MKIKKTWLTVHFYEGKATIELTINYEKKTYSMTHANNDSNVTFTSEDGKDNLSVHFDRVRCVNAALRFVKQELFKP
jgi:hypothetical protein